MYARYLSSLLLLVLISSRCSLVVSETSNGLFTTNIEQRSERLRIPSPSGSVNSEHQQPTIVPVTNKGNKSSYIMVIIVVNCSVPGSCMESNSGLNSNGVNTSQVGNLILGMTVGFILLAMLYTTYKLLIPPSSSWKHLRVLIYYSIGTLQCIVHFTDMQSNWSSVSRYLPQFCRDWQFI